MAKLGVDPIVQSAADSLRDRLKTHSRDRGGFLEAVGIGWFDGYQSIYVNLSRELRSDEKGLVPSEWDGVPVMRRVVGPDSR